MLGTWEYLFVKITSFDSVFHALSNGVFFTSWTRKKNFRTSWYDKKNNKLIDTCPSAYLNLVRTVITNSINWIERKNAERTINPASVHPFIKPTWIICSSIHICHLSMKNLYWSCINSALLPSKFLHTVVNIILIDLLSSEWSKISFRHVHFPRLIEISTGS